MEQPIVKNCPICNSVKREILPDGSWHVRRCRCDWEKLFVERTAATVSPSWWLPDGTRANMQKWDPPLFQNDTRFKNLMQVQKTVACKRLCRFCYDATPVQGGHLMALEKSIGEKRNLFVRGPKGSGRGMIVANIKALAAARNISATPNPGEWSVFKNDAWLATLFGKEGENGRQVFECKYQMPSLLVLEGVDLLPAKSNGQFRFRAADRIDLLLADRQALSGSAVLTSVRFAGQIGDSYGEKFQETLLSPMTSLILLFSPGEADLLLGAIKKRAAKVRAACVNPDAWKRKGDEGSREMDAERRAEAIEDAFYFEEAFGEIPGEAEGKRMGAKVACPEMFPEIDRVKEVLTKEWSKLVGERKSKPPARAKGIDRACLEAARGCVEVTGGMLDREMLEAGRLMARACCSAEKLGQLAEEEKALKALMVVNPS